jgi:hypothetical protein
MVYRLLTSGELYFSLIQDDNKFTNSKSCIVKKMVMPFNLNWEFRMPQEITGFQKPVIEGGGVLFNATFNNISVIS